MAIGAQSVPMRWMAGPLDIARRQKEKDFTAEVADSLRKWLDPALLALVQGTPINCLVVSWASGSVADAEQQQALKPLIERGRQAGLDFVGLIEGPGDKSAALAAARAAGLSAVAMDAVPPGNAGVPVIAWGKSGEALWGANSPILAVSDGFWPGIGVENTVSGGPLNLATVISNGALLSMGRAFAPAKAQWIVADPPRAAKLTAEDYLLAVADVEAYGGRWLISLDDQMRAGLATNSAPAAETWKRVTGALTFFAQNKATGTLERMGRLAVLSNFSGPDRSLGEGALNALPRWREPSRLIPRSQALAASFTGLEGIFYVDQEPPDPKLRQKLIAFVNAGGTLFVRAKWPNPEGSPVTLPAGQAYLLFNLRSVGKGRLAVLKEDQPDPYFTASDIQVILSHRGDPVRLYGGSSMNFFYLVSPQGRQGVIHLVNYARKPGSDAPLVYVKAPYKSARFVSPEIAAPVAVQWAPQKLGGAELFLPFFSVYGAVQLEG